MPIGMPTTIVEGEHSYLDNRSLRSCSFHERLSRTLRTHLSGVLSERRTAAAAATAAAACNSNLKLVWHQLSSKKHRVKRARECTIISSYIKIITFNCNLIQSPPSVVPGALSSITKATKFRDSLKLSLSSPVQSVSGRSLGILPCPWLDKVYA